MTPQMYLYKLDAIVRTETTTIIYFNASEIEVFESNHIDDHSFNKIDIALSI